MEIVNTVPITIDFRKPSKIPMPQVHQYDTNEFEFTVLENGTPADLSTVDRIVANYRRPDKSVITREISALGNVITYQMGAEEMAQEGLGELNVQLFAADRRLSSMAMKVYVHQNLGAAFEGGEGLPLLQDLFVEVTGLVEDTQTSSTYALNQGDYALQAGDSVVTNWLSPVADYASVTAIASPELGDTVQTNDDGKVYRYDGAEWKYTQGYSATALANVNAQLAESTQKVTGMVRNFITPQYVEYFGSFNRFGLGTPSGVANYTGGNYVLSISGNAGDSFVTVQNGNITDAGATTRWACVIENSDGLFEVNQVTGTDGVSVVNLLEPLKESISNKRLGNLHDSSTGQHYTELGYFAYAQHFYKMNPRHTERKSYIARFKPDDISGKWMSNAFNAYNSSANMKNANLYYQKIGSKNYYANATANTHYVEWEQFLDGEKGYFESYIGMSRGTLLVEFFKDGVLSESRVIGSTVERIIFDYENVQLAKIKITAQGVAGDFSTAQVIYIGLTTWWKNEKFQSNQLINPDDKVVYIGDSWGEYHNKATTRELSRIMQADGGSPIVLDYSKGGHTSTYARTWFDEYVIKNNPDKVVIEYFTNDFNSINGTNVGTFTNPDGLQQDMNIASFAEYVYNMTYMIDKAVENGIQPIVIMPASAASESQALSAANYAVQLWLGKALSNENPSFKNATAEKVLTKILETIGTESLELLSKEINSASRKGVKSNSNVNLTGGYIHSFLNNGTQKAGIKHNGTMESPYFQAIPFTYAIGAASSNRGSIFIEEVGGADVLKVSVKQSDGSYIIKTIQLT